jgi:hypothetical protein
MKRVFPALLLGLSLIPAVHAQYTQVGSKIVPTGSVGSTVFFGWSVAISADGNTAIVGAAYDNNLVGAVYIFVRNNGTWTQQAKLSGSGYSAPSTYDHQGASVAISSDGNTIAFGGSSDGGDIGAVWVFTRSNGSWTQQGSKLTPTGGLGSANRNGGDMGVSLGMSGDGNTIVVGAPDDNNFTGAAYIFTRSNGSWSQSGSKLVPSDVSPPSQFGQSVAISQDGNTFVAAGNIDANSAGGAWIFVRSNSGWAQQSHKLLGTDPVSQFGNSTAISADGNTVEVGSISDNFVGAGWIFTRSETTWSLQAKLLGSGNAGASGQGGGAALSADGNTAVVGGENDNSNTGAFWVFKRTGTTWQQQGTKYVGTGGANGDYQGVVAISGDGSTILDASQYNSNNIGALWIFQTRTPAPVSVSATYGSGNAGVFVFTFSDPSGYQNLTVLNVLIRDVLDGRHACYVAFTPNGQSSGSVFLVDDAGDAGGPFSGMVIPGNSAVNNSQCSISGVGTTASGSGNGFTLTLPITFTPGFSGNKVVYMAAQNGAGSSGWFPLGVWLVSGGTVTGPAVSGNFPRTTGLTQTYNFTFTDPAGFQDISVANVLINSAINGAGACYLAITPAGAVYLVDNAGDAAGPFSGMVLPTSNSVSNSQCTVSGAGSSVSGSGTNLMVTIAVTFGPGFAGNQIIYAAGRSNSATSGWQSISTVGVP